LNTITPAVINKGNCPNFNQIRFWYDQNETGVYAYGGEFSQLNTWVGPGTVPLNNLWKFVPLNPGPGGSWQEVDTSADGGWQRLIRPSGGAVASAKDVGYNLGGYYDSWTSQSTSDLGGGFLPAPGMQICNFTTNKCSNNSALGYSSNGAFEFGGLVHVPTWGPEGLVVVIGGQTSPMLNLFSDGQKYQNMANISLFEPTTQQWYYQTSTGEVPPQRDRFCVVGSTAGGDNGTFEIYMYGGQYGAGAFSSASSSTNAASDEVYVLSLPAFQWFKAEYTSSDPRILHTCHALGSQMLSVGGIDPSAASYQDAIDNSDNFTQGIKVFDLTKMQWTNSWDPSLPEYETPEVVNEYTSSAGKNPASWDMPELQAIFNGSGPAKSSGASGSGSKSSKSNIGAIVGGVVGGVLGLALIGLIAFYLLYWKNRKPPGNGEAATDLTSAEMTGTAEMGGAENEIMEVESPPTELPIAKGPTWELPGEARAPTELP
jgi:hypothetical protein